MKLAIFGATGAVGELIVRQAQREGHDVTAFIRNPAKLTTDVNFVKTDLSNIDVNALAEHLRGTDAVLSAAGATPGNAGVLTKGMRSILDAMNLADAVRLVVLTAAPVSTFASKLRPNPPMGDPGYGYIASHFIVPKVQNRLHDHYEDLADAEELVRESATKWTIVRPPLLTDDSRSAYRVAYGTAVKRGRHISRANVADFMLKTIDRHDTIGQMIGLAE
jgi:uncharacterized protein YbjT (DUF2867 family)